MGVTWLYGWHTLMACPPSIGSPIFFLWYTPDLYIVKLWCTKNCAVIGPLV